MTMTTINITGGSLTIEPDQEALSAEFRRGFDDATADLTETFDEELAKKNAEIGRLAEALTHFAFTEKPEVGTRVVRVGKHLLDGFDLGDDECKVGWTGEVVGHFGCDDPDIEVIWDEGDAYSIIAFTGLAPAGAKPEPELLASAEAPKPVVAPWRLPQVGDFVIVPKDARINDRPDAVFFGREVTAEVEELYAGGSGTKPHAWVNSREAGKGQYVDLDSLRLSPEVSVGDKVRIVDTYYTEHREDSLDGVSYPELIGQIVRVTGIDGLGGVSVASEHALPGWGDKSIRVPREGVVRVI